MQQTYQDRLTIDSTQQRWMGAFGSLYGDLQRKLYMHASTGERLNDLKSDFCRENGISARHFNALRMEGWKVKFLELLSCSRFGKKILCERSEKQSAH